MRYNMYYILAGVLVVYLLITIVNRKTARKRKSRTFMEGYHRKHKRKERDGKLQDKDENKPQP